MNLLLVNPPGAKSKSKQFYICDCLREKFKVNTFVTYLDDNKPQYDKDYFFSFSDWVRKNKENINKKNIHDLEKEYPNSNLWTIIVSQRTFYDYSYLNGLEAFSKPKIEHTLFVLKSLVMFYSDIIKKYKIDTVLAHAGDNMHSTTLFVLARSMEFSVFQSNAILFKERLYYLCDDEYFRSSELKRRHSKYLKNYKKYVLLNYKKLEDFRKSLLGFNPVVEVKDIWKDINFTSMLRSNFRTIKIFFASHQFNSNFGNLTKTKVLLIKLKALSKRYIYYFLTEYLVKYNKEVPTNPYVYFPLHLQPEATLLSTTPVFSDQLSIIRSLSASLPAGYKLVVKDYPLQAGKRPYNFYSQILKLPNTLLYHRLFPSLSLVEKSDLVITVQGTVGFEALLRNKKVLLFGRSIYESIYGIKHVNNYKDLQHILKEFIFEDLDIDKQNKSIMAYLSAWLDILYKSSDYSEYQLNEVESSAHRMITLLEKNLQFDNKEEIKNV